MCFDRSYPPVGSDWDLKSYTSPSLATAGSATVTLLTLPCNPPATVSGEWKFCEATPDAFLSH
jgi:hypothetical protein